MIIWLIGLLILLHTVNGEKAAVTRKETLLIKELATWEVASFEQNIFKDWSLHDFKHMLIGHIPRKMRGARSKPLDSFIPTFDPRKTSRSECLRDIPYQGQCASSWAISIADSLADRYCIANSLKGIDLSAQYLISCDRLNYGCMGGLLSQGWLFVQEKGTVSETCFPYDSVFGHAPSCPLECVNKEQRKSYRCKKDSLREISYMVPEMIQEINMHGSLSTSMILYKDFMYYRGGIYKHVYGEEDLGRHAVRCVGYGEVEQEKYWLCANSWGKLWGEDGWFRIAFGDSDIEGDVWACEPELVSH